MPVQLKIKPGDRPAIMAVLNLTPDSFYRQSRNQGLDMALKATERFVEEGADIIDIGAESSRPGAIPISVEEEAGRLNSVVKEIKKQFTVQVSVDTYKPEVAEMVLDNGADIINDITGLSRYPEMANIIAKHNAGLILMHMKGTPLKMQDSPVYEDLFSEIKNFLSNGIQTAEQAGVGEDAIAVDPGIGFGKNLEHNLRLVANLKKFKELGKAVILGASRKSFIGKVLGLPVEQRLEGSLVAAIFGMLQGADVIRVHDVAPTWRALEMGQAFLEKEE
ncbi:MAG: dihydropteroate synthase [Candidatus Nitronauta litoralis]|uniref:dihydropteroate synthase n=1 Tax=Candidatus Nitronauta litoralis TaxID=2705533 RepID=A0A7T0BYT1_9BACT|nr:MAG: dihydropteroate synthase [Candidatus Nitronauta litoralis]